MLSFPNVGWSVWQCHIKYARINSGRYLRRPEEMCNGSTIQCKHRTMEAPYNGNSIYGNSIQGKIHTMETPSNESKIQWKHYTMEALYNGSSIQWKHYTMAYVLQLKQLLLLSSKLIHICETSTVRKFLCLKPKIFQNSTYRQYPSINP